jgi:WD40 repeat protein
MRLGIIALLAGSLIWLTGEARAGQMLLVASYLNNDVRAYDAVTGAFDGNFVAPNSGGLKNPGELAFGPNGDLFVSSSTKNGVYEYNGTTGAFVREYTAGLSSPRGLAFAADGSLLVASAGNDSIVKFALNGTPEGTFATAAGAPIGITFGPDGDLYAAIASSTQNAKDGYVERFDGTTGAALGAFGTGHLNNPQSLTFGPDGNLYVDIQYDYTIVQFNGTSGAFQKVFVTESYPYNPSTGIVFGPNGNLFTGNLTGGASGDGVLQFNGTSGAFVNNFVAGNGSFWATGLVFTPVPEPSTFTLAGMAMAALLAVAIAGHRRAAVDLDD